MVADTSATSANPVSEPAKEPAAAAGLSSQPTLQVRGSGPAYCVPPVITRRYARPVSAISETAALVALVRHGRRSEREYSTRLQETGSAGELLELEHGLFAEDLLQEAAFELEKWSEQGIRVLSPLDPGYPANLRAVPDRPLLIFVAGRLEPRDARSVAVIGSRRASIDGLATASAVADQLVKHGITVVSGLAAGIDTAAHTAALASGGRTLAVIGTGLWHSYPPQNRSLQQRIAHDGAVISRFWPDTPPMRRGFPLRNALMSGISLATVVVEATHTSGARIQARLALAQGRPVILLHSLLEQEWARELERRPGTHVVQAATEVPALLERLTEGALAA